MSKKHKFLAPINIHLSILIDEVEICGYKIRRRTKEETLKYYNVKSLFTDSCGGVAKVVYAEKEFDYIHWIFQNELGLNCKFILEIPAQKEDSFIRDEAADLLTSLRLYKNGKVEIPIIFSEKLGHFQNVKLKIVKDERLYRLEKDDITEIEQIHKKITGLKNKKYWLLIERFNNAISNESSFKNAFVDLAGILESILLQNNKNELRFRFSLHLSNLLNLLGSSITFKKAQTIYDIRSKLVHTGDAKGFNEALFFELLNYTRIIIKWYLENNLDDSKAQEILFEKLELKYE